MSGYDEAPSKSPASLSNPPRPSVSPPAAKRLGHLEDYIVYIDGKADASLGVAGWGLCGVLGGTPRPGLERSGAAADMTYHRAELVAVLEALEMVDQETPFTIVASNKILIDSASIWRLEWRENSWKKPAGGIVANDDLWRKIDEALSDGRQVNWRMLEGHHDKAGSRIAQALARAEVKQLRRGQ